MRIGAYALGVVCLACSVGSLAAASVWLRRGLLPDASGAAARLAEVVLGIAAAVVVSEFLGSFGWLGRAPLIVASLFVAAVGRLAGRHLSATRGDRASSPEAGTLILAITGVVTVLVIGQWAAWSIVGLRSGPAGVDTLRYHLPLAARFVQSGRITGLQFLDQDLLATYSPLNTELLHADAIALLGSDLLSSVLNLAWVAIALLAACVLGASNKPVRVQVLLAVATSLAVPVLVVSDAGAATNDIATVSLLLVATVCLVRWHAATEARPTGWLVISGLAAGLAIGTKFTAAAPFLAMLVVVVWLARTRSRRSVLAWTAPAPLTGAFWFARNWIAVGSPLPEVHIDLGLFQFPEVQDPVLRLSGYDVVHYVGTPGFFSRVVGPGLSQAFGPLWWLLAAAALFGIGRSLWRGPGQARIVAVIALSAAVAYPFTPYGAGGPQGHPWLFTVDLRFALVALNLGLVSFALSAAPSPWLRKLAAAVLTAGFLSVMVGHAGPYRGWPTTNVWPGLVVGLLAAVAVMTVHRLRHGSSKWLLPAGALVGAAMVATGGYFVQRRYSTDRYATVPVASWARRVHAARIGEIGYPLAYPLYGPNLSNRVVYLEPPDGHGGLLPLTSCMAWATNLQALHLSYVVFGTNPTLEAPSANGPLWTSKVTDSSLVYRDPTASIIRLRGRINPQGCNG